MSELFRPACLEELFVLLDRYPDARIMAGGTDLLVQLRRSTSSDAVPLLLLERIEALRLVREQDGFLTIGAGTTFSSLIGNELVASRAPLLVEACRNVGGPALRNMATIGGNIVSASPAGDSLPPLYLFDAELELLSRRGIRRFALADFIQGPGETILNPGEILHHISIPFQSDDALTGFEKVGLRRSLAVAVASFCGFLNLSAGGVVTEARFAWGSVAPTVVRFRDLEDGLVGRRLDPASIKGLAENLIDRVAPIDDIRATAEYRRHVAANMMIRFLELSHV